MAVRLLAAIADHSKRRRVLLIPSLRIQFNWAESSNCLYPMCGCPKTRGIKVQKELSRAGPLFSAALQTLQRPCVMKAGAVDFLTKAFQSQDLLDAVFAALVRN